MAKNNEMKGVEKISTTLGKETVFKGTMKFSESLKIDGNFEGDIESSGFLYIEEGAEVKADIKVRAVVVGGVCTWQYYSIRQTGNAFNRAGVRQYQNSQTQNSGWGCF